MKFLNKFNSISDAKAGNDIYSPQVTLVKENGKTQVIYSKDDFEDYTKLQVHGDEIGELSFIEFIPTNIIRYKGTAKVTPNNRNVFGANYIDVESTFDSETGNGVLVFDGDVTSIGDHAFQNCIGLTSMTIPNSVTSIGQYALFNCTGLTSIIIPNGVTSIGKVAFASCRSLASVMIPNSVTSIGNAAFNGCSGLTSITIPNSVTSIEEQVFYTCHGLTSVEIPNSVTSIGKEAFGGCTGLTSVTIPNSVTSIGERAFSLVANIVYSGITTGSPWGARCRNGYVDGNLVYNDETKTILEACLSAWQGEIVIPISVTSIGDYAFYGCSGLTSATIGNSVTSIGDNAFYECTGLTSVTIPNSVTSIGTFAFARCSGLTSISYTGTITQYNSISKGSFWNLTVPSTTQVYCLGENPPAYTPM